MLPLRIGADWGAVLRRFNIRSVNLAQAGILPEASGGLAGGEIAEADLATAARCGFRFFPEREPDE
jgi:hypothetical protein